ncbi:Leucine-rich repeat protein [Phytophthora palmivora]|uniref:Leucine-rich repeat protein n=1 Tax=Phytophthora palmivora TaxID=4796 RepID=A0A2P4XKQ9_9STRA|nr:Leucine-rich repeat protein [Phytophthora palmivora]
MITTRSLGSRSSFGDFPSHSSSISLSSDQELVNLACISLRQAPVEVQALDLSTNTRKPRRPLKNIKALSELTNLVHLDLSGNAVERLDGLQIFTQLQTLAIPRNNLKTLAASLFTLRGLTHLDLSGNFIAHLPRAFSGLKMLEQLNLSGNNLGTLREVDVLAPLSNLLSCNLAANPFCRLPTYKDYVICKIRSLERLDDAEISRVARDRAAKRFSNAIFSQDACLREAGRAHEDEQNRLLEAQSALEAENLRLKGELQVKSKLLQNKSRAWSSATEQLLQLQQEVAMLNLDRRRSVSLSSDHANEAEQIAVAIAARHKSTYLIHQRPQSAPRLPSPKRSVEKRRGSFSYSDEQLTNNELLSPNMLDEIKADIYAKLSQQLAPSTGKTEAENSVNKNQTDFHQAIASALENRLQLGVNSSQQPLDVDDTPPADDVCCGQFDEFAPVETYYARKYVMAKDRISSFVKSISDDEGNISSSIQITSAQRILKICERLEAAEAKSSFDPVSKIEVDQQGNSRGSLKIMLLAARDLPTAHLRTKNLDPYVCFEVVYPSHAIPPSFRANSTVGKIFRSQTKKKSIYPVWEEDFEVTPILSLNGFLHVRVLNDRRLSREQLVGEVRIPLQTLVHQKRIVDWFSLGLNVPPASGNVVSKLCGGAVRLQLQLYFSSVERYKHVVDELVVRYLHDHSELPPFIDAVDECENRMEQEFPAEQPEQSTTESPLNTSESMSYAPRRQMDVESHFPLDELATSLPSYTSKQSSPPMTRMDIGESSIQLNSNTRVNSNVDTTPNTSTQLSPERRKSLWETKTLKATTFDDKKAYFGFSATTERRKQSTTLSMSSGPPRRSQTPTQSKRIRNAALQQHVSLRRKSVETPECFDEYSPYHPGFKSGDVLDACNNEHGGVRNGRTTSRSCDPNRKTDLSIFKSPSLTRRPPSSGFPERYIGLDNQTCERLKRIFGRMDSTS